MLGEREEQNSVAIRLERGLRRQRILNASANRRDQVSSIAKVAIAVRHEKIRRSHKIDMSQAVRPYTD